MVAGRCSKHLAPRCCTAQGAGQRSREHPRDQRLLPRLRRRLVQRRRARRRRPGGALHPQEARRGASRSTRSRYCLRRGRASARRRSTSSSSTTSRSPSSPACSRPTCASAPRGSARSSRRVPLWLQARSSGSRTRSSAALERIGYRMPKDALVHRAPRDPRGQRLLPLALRAGRGPHRRRRGRVGHDAASASGEGNAIELHRRAATSRTRSACSTRRSPTSPASGSTPASTS